MDCAFSCECSKSDFKVVVELAVVDGTPDVVLFADSFRAVNF